MSDMKDQQGKENNAIGAEFAVGPERLHDILSWTVQNTDIVPYIIGEAGIGKSAITMQASLEYYNKNKHKQKKFSEEQIKALEEQNIDPDTIDIPYPLMSTPGCLELMLSNIQDVGDLTGIPRDFWVNMGTHKQLVQQWALPEVIPLWHEFPMVIFLDELNRADLRIRQAALQLILSKRVHVHKFPKGCKMVAAGNPDSGEYDVEAFDEAISDRMMHILFRTNYEEFFEYAYGRIEPPIMNFLNENRDKLVREYNMPDIEVNPSPRKWEAFSTVMSKWNDRDPFCTQANLQHIAAGLVGASVGRSFCNWYYHGGAKAVGAETIFDISMSFPEEALKAQKDYGDRTFYTVHTTARYWEDMTDPDKMNDEIVRRLDRLFGCLPNDNAYALALILAGESKENTLGYKALEKCHRAHKHMERITADREDYKARPKS